MQVHIGTLRASVKALDTDDGPGEFEAILSTSATDREGETIVGKAFDPLPASIPLYHQHDWMEKALPVGRATPYYDGEVLKAKGVWASTSRAQEIRTLVNEGVIDAMSVGFLVSKSKGKEITKAGLLEASFTAVPTNTTALILNSKSLAEAIVATHLTPNELRPLDNRPPLERGELFVKAGARNNSTDQGRLQQIHDLAVENGASCSGAKALDDKAPVKTKTVAGSYEDRQEDIREALVEFCAPQLALAYPNTDPDDRAWRVNIVATFDDRVVFQIGWDDDDAYQVTYTWDGEEVTITGDPEAVSIDQVISPAPADDQENSTSGKSVSAPATAGAESEEPGAAAPDAEIELALLSINAAVTAALAI